MSSLLTSRTARLWLFPVFVLMAGSVLTGLGWSGSSVGVTLEHPSHVIAGTPRYIRWDEWNIVTPLVVAQSHHGYPQAEADSVGSHDAGVILDVPTKTWPTIFRPWDYGIFFLDVTRAFAFRWWAMSIVLLLGSYALLVQLTRRVAPSVVFSIALWASPFFHWWYLDVSLASTGLAMAALASFLAASDRPPGWSRVGLTAICIWGVVGFGLVLYPPFQIPVAIVIVLLGLGDRYAFHRSIPGLARAVAPNLAIVGLASIAILVVYYLSNRGAIHLINNTLYPGHRRSNGGGTSLYQFFSAPYDVELALHGSRITSSNQSELSSFLILAPYVGLQLLRVRLSSLDPRARSQVVGVSSALTILTAWYFIGLPGPLATITGLARVPGPRSLLGVGLASLLFVSIFVTALGSAPQGDLSDRRSKLESRRDLLIGSAISSAAAFAVTYWSGRLLAAAFPALGIGAHKELFSSLAVAVVVLFLSMGRAVLGGSLLAILGLILTLPINPLYSGLAPYTSKSVTNVFTSVPGSRTSGWVSFVNQPVSDELLASGLRTLTAVNVYPNPVAWRTLDAAQSDSYIWNRYANLVFVPDSQILGVRLKLLAPDAIEVSLNPCGDELSRLDVRFLVSGTPLSDSCLRLVRSEGVLNVQVFIYERAER